MMKILKCFIFFFTGCLLYHEYFCQDHHRRHQDDFSADFDDFATTHTVNYKLEVEQDHKRNDDVSKERLDHQRRKEDDFLPDFDTHYDKKTASYNSEEVKHVFSDVVNDERQVLSDKHESTPTHTDEQKETGEENENAQQRMAEQLRDEQERKKNDQVQLRVQQMHDNFLKRRTMQTSARSESLHDGMLKKSIEEEVESVERLSSEKSGQPSVTEGDQILHSAPVNNEFVIKFDPRLKYSSSEQASGASRDVDGVRDKTYVLQERLASNLEAREVTGQAEQLDLGLSSELTMKESDAKSELSPHEIQRDIVSDYDELKNDSGQKLLHETYGTELSGMNSEQLKDEGPDLASDSSLSDMKSASPYMHTAAEGREDFDEYQKTNIARSEFQERYENDGEQYNEDDSEEDEDGYDENEDADDEGDDGDDDDEEEEYEEDDGYETNVAGNEHTASLSNKIAEQFKEVPDLGDEQHGLNEAVSKQVVVEGLRHFDSVLTTGHSAQLPTEENRQDRVDGHEVQILHSNKVARATVEVLYLSKMSHRAREDGSDGHQGKVQDSNEGIWASQSVRSDDPHLNDDEYDVYHSAAEAELQDIPPDNLEFILTASGRDVHKRYDGAGEEKETVRVVDGSNGEQDKWGELSQGSNGVFEEEVIGEIHDQKNENKIDIHASYTGTDSSNIRGVHEGIAQNNNEMGVGHSYVHDVIDVSDGYVHSSNTHHSKEINVSDHPRDVVDVSDGDIWESNTHHSKEMGVSDHISDSMDVSDGYVQEGSGSHTHYQSSEQIADIKGFGGSGHVHKSHSPLKHDVVDDVHHLLSPDKDGFTGHTKEELDERQNILSASSSDSITEIEHSIGVPSHDRVVDFDGRGASQWPHVGNAVQSHRDVQDEVNDQGNSGASSLDTSVPLQHGVQDEVNDQGNSGASSLDTSVPLQHGVQDEVNDQGNSGASSLDTSVPLQHGVQDEVNDQGNSGASSWDTSVPLQHGVQDEVNDQGNSGASSLDTSVPLQHGVQDEVNDQGNSGASSLDTSVPLQHEVQDDRGDSVDKATQRNHDDVVISHNVDRNTHFSESDIARENSQTLENGLPASSQLVETGIHDINASQHTLDDNASLSESLVTKESFHIGESPLESSELDNFHTGSERDINDANISQDSYDVGGNNDNIHIADKLEFSNSKSGSSDEPDDSSSSSYGQTAEDNSLIDLEIENITEADYRINSSEGIFISDEDEGQTFHNVDLESSSKIYESSEHIKQLEEVEMGHDSKEALWKQGSSAGIDVRTSDKDHEDVVNEEDAVKNDNNYHTHQESNTYHEDSDKSHLWNLSEYEDQQKEHDADFEVTVQSNTNSNTDAVGTNESVESEGVEITNLTSESHLSSDRSHSADEAVKLADEGSNGPTSESSETPVISDQLTTNDDESSPSDHSWTVLVLIRGPFDLIISTLEMFMDKLLPQSVYGIFLSTPFGLQPGYAACLYMAVGFITFICISLTCKVFFKKSRTSSGENKEVVSKESVLALQKEKENGLQEINKLRSKVRDTEAQMQKCTSHIYVLTSELHKTKVERDNLQQTFATQQSQISDLGKQVTDHTQSIGQYAQANQQLQENLQQMTVHASSLETHYYEMQAYTQQVQAVQVEYESKIQCLTAELTVIQSTKDEALLEIERLQECITELSKEVTGLREEQKLNERKIETYDIELNKLRSSYSELKLSELEFADITALDVSLASSHVGSSPTEDGGVQADHVADGGENVMQNKRTKLIEKLLKSFGDVGELTAKLNKIEIERNSLQRALTSEIELRMQHEERVQALAEQLEKESTTRQLTEQDLKQAALKIDVLSSFYSESTCAGDPSRLINEKISGKSVSDVHREKLDEMAKEKQKLEVEFRKQIAVEEKKAHELWLAARQSEREASQYKSEAQFLKDKVAELQSKLDNAVPERKVGSDSTKSPLTVDDRPNSSGTGFTGENPPRFMPFPPHPNFGGFGQMPRPFLPHFVPPPPHMPLRRPPSELSRDSYDRYSDPYRAHSPFFRERSPTRRDKLPPRRRSPTSPTNDSIHSSNSASRLSPLSDVPKRPIYGRDEFNPRLSSTLDRSSDSVHQHSSLPAFREPHRDADYRSGTRGPPR